MWKQGSVQGFIIFSASQMRGKKYVLEYFSFRKTSMLQKYF
jgi:hypothetical protein